MAIPPAANLLSMNTELPLDPPAPSQRTFNGAQNSSRVWLITGVSSGLGYEMTRLLLDRGERVAGTTRNLAPLEELKAKHGDRLWLASLDLTDSAAIRRVVGEAVATLGRLDVVVSNAGYGLFGAAEELTDEQIVHQIDTNLVGSIQTIRAVLPFLRAQGGGRIIQVSSEGGQVAYPNFSLYHATKWGIKGFVEAVAQEVVPFGIEFTLAEPGPTHTNFAKGLVGPPPMAAYEHTPAGEVRRAVRAGAFPIKGDAVRTAQAMIDSADQHPAPRRLTLGSTAYENVHAALRQRLETLEAQREVAFSADAGAIR